MRRASIALALTAILGASCGDGMPDALATRLQGDVAAIRTHAEAGNRGIARHALEELEELVARRMDAGVLGGEEGLEILAAAKAVDEQLALLSAPPAEESPSPTPVEEEGEGNGKPDKDKGKGNDGDQGNGND